MIRARDGSGGERFEEIHKVCDPLKIRHRSTPCNGDVPTSNSLACGVVRNGDVPCPVSVLAPHLRPPRLLEEVREVDVCGGVEVARDGIAVVVHPKRVEELAGRELAASAVLGERVEVESVVAALSHLAVTDEL